MQPKHAIILFLLIWGCASAQPGNYDIASEASGFCEDCDQQRWWQIHASIPFDQLQQLYDYLGFEGPYFKVLQSHDESNGRSHLLLQQYHNGIPVFGGMLKAHTENGYFTTVHGWYFPPDLFHTPEALPLPTEKIIGSIQQKLPDIHFAWESPEWETALKQRLSDPEATYLPQPELYYFNKEEGFSSFSLAYKSEIRSIEPDEVYTAWTDAFTGLLLNLSHKSHHCQTAAIRFESHYYGSKNMQIRQRGWPHSDVILESCEPYSLSTRTFALNSFGERKSWGRLDRIVSDKFQWGIDQQTATTGHWTLLQAMDYFSSQTGWIGPSARGEETRLLVDWTDEQGQALANARYLREKDVHYIYAGSIEGNSLTTLDIMGHEYAHAFIEEFAGLENQRESGALGEGIADVFGFLIEKRVLENSGDWNWTIGEASGYPLRSLKDPHDFAMPMAANGQDPFWVGPTPDQCPTPSPLPSPLGNDNCGIHQNASILSHWFYLLTQGGVSKGIEIRPIAMEEAESILFRMVRYYLLPSSNFNDARKASIMAARDLFGDCSQQVAQTENAWAAVGVGTQNRSDCISILGSDAICTNEPERQYLFDALGPEDADFEWGGIPDNWFYRVQGQRNELLSIESLPETVDPVELLLIASWNGKRDTAKLALTPSDCSQKAPRQPDPIPGFNEIRLFPNPASRKTNLYLPEGLFPAEVEVYDAKGSLILKDFLTSSVSAFDLTGWNRGIYFVKVQSARASWQNKLLIAE